MAHTNIVIQGNRIGRFRASVLLCKETFRFLALDTEMLFVPVIAFALELVLLGALVFVLLLSGSLDLLSGSRVEVVPADYISLFLSYLLSAFVIAWTQAAIAHIVYTRAHGGNSSLGDGIGVAFRNWLALLVWSAITSTVGVILRAIAERSGILMRIVVALMGAAWSVLTYFVVPSIVIGKRTAFGAIGDSGSVFKRTWGETLVTNVSFGLVFTLVFFLFMLGLIGIGFIVGWSITTAVVLMMIFLFGVFMLSLLSSVLASVLRTLLYIYASEGSVPENFNRELLEQIVGRAAPTVVPGSGTSFVGQ